MARRPPIGSRPSYGQLDPMGRGSPISGFTSLRFANVNFAIAKLKSLAANMLLRYSAYLLKHLHPPGRLKFFKYKKVMRVTRSVLRYLSLYLFIYI